MTTDASGNAEPVAEIASNPLAALDTHLAGAVQSNTLRASIIQAIKDGIKAGIAEYHQERDK